MNSAHELSPYKQRAIVEDETLASGDCDSSGMPPSPLMKPREHDVFDKYAPPPPPRPPKITEPPVSFDNTLPPIRNGLRTRDSQLLYLLDNGRHPEIAKFAEAQPLAPLEADDDHPRRVGHPRATPDLDCRGRASLESHIGDFNFRPYSIKSETLKSLAACAVSAATTKIKHEIEKDSPTDISDSTRDLSIKDGKASAAYGGLESSSKHVKARVSALVVPEGGLAPIVSPGSSTNGHSLPSIRSIPALAGVGYSGHSLSDQDSSARYASVAGFANSPSLGPPQLPPASARHGSPPISPPESYQRSLPSPRSVPAGSPYNHYNQSHLFTPEYGPTPEATESVSQVTVVESSPLGERQYVNEAHPTSAQATVYPCDFQGCKAPPFQTQYLLNSHANVHSQARPHYCPVAGCSRGEGGKGFKRKNEMIRHGLVHESPGYVCPFCPEKDHRYPRPDNLQRHVRVHHTDKGKDDPQLREVLAQRPEGPNRGRRRRGGA